MKAFRLRSTAVALLRRLPIALALSATLLTASAAMAQNSPAAQRGQWKAAMGEAGLRRSLASGADLGELVNRAVTYQVASRIYDRQSAEMPGLDPRSIDSHVESYVAQNDSLLPVDAGTARPLFVRALARIAWRNEEKRASG